MFNEKVTQEDDFIKRFKGIGCNVYVNVKYVKGIAKYYKS
jgi:hypothetical protein